LGQRLVLAGYGPTPTRWPVIDSCRPQAGFRERLLSGKRNPEVRLCIGGFAYSGVAFRSMKYFLASMCFNMLSKNRGFTSAIWKNFGISASIA